ncbi:MAG: hypothetical protein O3A47_04145 [Chloroflexi bacterium]|nr:hypothetical protein [Chloroflexota bacterium]
MPSNGIKRLDAAGEMPTVPLWYKEKQAETRKQMEASVRRKSAQDAKTRKDSARRKAEQIVHSNQLIFDAKRGKSQADNFETRTAVGNKREEKKRGRIYQRYKPKSWTGDPRWEG